MQVISGSILLCLLVVVCTPEGCRSMSQLDSDDQSIVSDNKTWCTCKQTEIQRGSGPKIKPRKILQQPKDVMLEESEKINGLLKRSMHGCFPNVSRSRDPVKVLKKSCPSNDTRCSFWKKFEKNLNFQPSQNQQAVIERIKFYRQGFAFFAHILNKMDKSNIFIETKMNEKVKSVLYKLLEKPIDKIFCELETISTALNIPDSCETIPLPPLILRISKARLVQYSPDLKRSDKLNIFSVYLASMHKFNNKFSKALREMKSWNQKASLSRQ